ncbi:putative RWD [Emericellopsis cladophorae]|uniref:RWD n=1 Tax=Emericellopsis cladophorae TaxID=2686198 RepID=A0A9P9XWB0_9HYPO|nr:putative RWD [Emericellopsis cladophorae]KAI6778930.1 putative RWD [Emericellopsis cladophorae]
MPFFDQTLDAPRKGKIIKSAYDSESFESDGTIHVDGLVGSATISPSGRDIALASPDGLAIIDLDSPYNPPRRLRSHGQPWLVTDVQWSPFAARDYWVVSTANHRALVWNLNLREDSASGAIEHSLQGHSRAITDINFSAHHPDILATCSVDGYVHSWDLRRPRQPVLTFCDWFAGASQVKYSRQDPHALASSHDRWLHVWDERRAREPVKSIAAHTSKIYGLDWNRLNPTSIVTCSLDKTIKFWDYSKDVHEPEKVIHTQYPVWRARHTPFGEGLLAMPQNEPGDLYLYDRQRLDEGPKHTTAEPVTVFPGHGQHKVKEFLWRSRGGIDANSIDTREFQLVSWGTDNELRLQCVDASILAAVGYTKGAPAAKGINLTRKGATYKTFRTIDEVSSRDRKHGTMSDPRAAVSNQAKQSALTMGMRSGTQGRHAKTGWRGPSMRAKVASKKDRNQSQIGWLKGITITKRTASGPGILPKRQMSKDSSVFGHGYPDDEWAGPDTIQDEVLRISMSMPKVRWENIDFDEMTLNASLNGPWGSGGDTIFIKVRIYIPEDYPSASAPKFYIEKTSFLPEETHQRMTREIHLLAEQFLQRKKNCLEVAFIYLLGEVDLETSTTLFKNVDDLDDGIGALVDESSSSEEDEDIPAGGSAAMSQELPPHADADTTLAPPNRSIIPPPARTCGARFSHDGRLVCFFPSKEERARALFSSNAELQKDKAKPEPYFAGFGRIPYEQSSKSKFATDEPSATEDQSDSDESDTSTSSSDSESTSIHKMSLWYHPRRQFRKTWSEDRSIRSSGGDTGTGIGTGTGTAYSRRRIPGRPRNLVTIHDTQPLLPSKRDLAKEYAIFGDGAEVCEHNAAVADKHGYKDMADVWRYLTLLLKKGIPLEVLSPDSRRNSILVIAHQIVSKTRSYESPDSGYDSAESDSGLCGRVKWGEHPLARDFIAELFDYFEKIADIQMLAMLSCIFSETSAADSVAYAESHLPQTETPLPLKAPSFSLEYFPTDASVWNLFGKTRSTAPTTTPRTPRTPLTPYYDGSQASEDVAWNEDPASNSYSCGETPPARGKAPVAGLDIAQGGTRSPHARSTHKANASLASSFTGLSRSFTGGSSASPPYYKKKPSPVETIINSLAPGMNSAVWGNASKTVTGDSSVGRISVDGDEPLPEDTLPLVPVSVSLFVEDQTMFDDDGWLSAHMLDPARAELHARSRYAYAEMLQMWDEPLSRLEIMKFNIMRSDGPRTVHHRDGSTSESFTIHEGSVAHVKTGSSPIVMGKKDQLHALIASGRGIDVTGICRIHETQLDSARYTSSDSHTGGAVGTCDRCHRTQSQLRCVYCLEPVDALFPPCLSCGCASHEACLAEWHAAGEELCPAGDECNCVEEAANGQVESWAALQGAMTKGPNKILRLPSPAVAEPDEEWGRKTSARSEEVASHTNETGLMPNASTLTFGRLRKSAGSWSRASSARRNIKKTL